MEISLALSSVYGNLVRPHIQRMQSYTFQDKTVLITGASLGIGAAFARELKRRGAQLILVARNQTRLETLAKELGGAVAIARDLAAPDAARELYETISARGLTVDVLINNAGFGSHFNFDEAPLSTQRGMIDLNVTALVELTHVFLPMLERQRGGVIQLASTAAFQPVPHMAVYAATKAFVLSFSEALWGELHERGVRVLALCPGATDTPFFERAGQAAAVGKKARPEDLVTLGLRAFERNRSYAIHGIGNYFTSHSSRFVPRQTTVHIAKRVMRKQHVARLREA
jgi:short-subunit dehydrogenase